jgi:hypothetical protein
MTIVYMMLWNQHFYKFHYMKMTFILQFFIFVGTDEYIQIIFVGFEIDEYKVIFVGLGRAPTNIWAIQFDFDRPHIFIGGATSLTNIIYVYSSVTWLHR